MNRELECEPVAVALDEDCPPECPREVIVAKFETGDCADYVRLKWCSDPPYGSLSSVAFEVAGVAYAADSPFGSISGTDCELSDLPACQCALTCLAPPFCWSEDAQ